jgi:hypothetical protein
MFTKKEHVKILAKNVVSRLEQDQAIVLDPRNRQAIYEDLFTALSPVVLTDDEIREKILSEMGLKADTLIDSGANESDQYKAAKSVIMNKVGENAVMGLYYQKSVKAVALQIAQFMMKHKFVEDVFPSDEELEKSIVDFLKRFNPEQLH